MALLKIKDTDGIWKSQGNVGVFGSSGKDVSHKPWEEFITFDADNRIYCFRIWGHVPFASGTKITVYGR